MGIRILPYRGGYRHYWYGEYREGGRLHQVRLSVKIAGVPPESLSIKDEGSVLYEKGMPTGKSKKAIHNISQ